MWTPALLPAQPHASRPDAEAEDNLLLARRDYALVRERERGSDGRVPGHRQLPAGGEDADAHGGARIFGREDERALRVVHLARDNLHRCRVKARRLREHRELVAAEGLIGEDVEVDVAKLVHFLLLGELNHAIMLYDGRLHNE